MLAPPLTRGLRAGAGSYASRKAYAEARPRVKGRFAKRGTLPGDEGYVPPGEEGAAGGAAGGLGGAAEEEDEDAVLQDDFLGGLLGSDALGPGLVPALQSPLAWLEAQGHKK